MFALIAMQLRRSGLEMITRAECKPPESFLKAIFRFTEAHRLMPDCVVLDTELAQQLGSIIAYHRLNGDVLALFGVRNNNSEPAYIRVIDLDWQVSEEWQYTNGTLAWKALHEWMLDRDYAPTGWVRDIRGNVNSSFLGGWDGRFI